MVFYGFSYVVIIEFDVLKNYKSKAVDGSEYYIDINVEYLFLLFA